MVIFSVNKRPKNWNFQGGIKANIFWGSFASAELCLLLRPTGCGLWIYCGFRSLESKNCSEKRSKNCFLQQWLVQCEQRSLFLCLSFKRELNLSKIDQSNIGSLYKLTIGPRSKIGDRRSYGLLHKYVRTQPCQYH